MFLVGERDKTLSLFYFKQLPMKNPIRNGNVARYKDNLFIAFINEKLKLNKDKEELIDQMKNGKLFIHSFSADNPYIFNEETQDYRNYIFFVYNDHYHANSGYDQYLGDFAKKVMSPHVMRDDRGYKYGVYVDIRTYLTFRMVKNSSIDLPRKTEYLFPRFGGSVKGQELRLYCKKMTKFFDDRMQEEILRVQYDIGNYIQKVYNVDILKCIKPI
jgi:hypothetical protein